MRSQIRRAAATHRRAAALVAAVDAALPARRVNAPPPAHAHSLRELTNRLCTAAAELAPGWLGAPLAHAPLLPLGAAGPPAFIRIGVARPPDGTSFPVVVPLGHLTFDAGPGDPRVCGALRATMLRLLAGAATGSLLVRVVDPADTMAAAFADLPAAGIMTPPVADRTGLDSVLTGAERWVSYHPDGRHLLVVLAGWPPATTRGDLDRVAALAASAPAGGSDRSARRLHLLVADWPADGQAAELPGATRVRLRPGGALVGHLPGGTFGARTGDGGRPTTGFRVRVVLDDVAPEVIREVCARLARQRRDHPRISLDDLLVPEPPAGEDVHAGPLVTLGRAGRAPVRLRLGTGSRHWLIGGHRGSGKTAMLHVILFGLVNDYGPEQLAVYLVDPVGDGFSPGLAGLAQVRAVGLGADRATAVLRELAERPAAGAPRAVCLLDGLHAVTDAAARSALRSLAMGGANQGVHLVLAGDGVPPRDVAANCTVRIALPGGQVLDPANDAATGLVLGSAVVNTASGLGGPRGATRAHERLVRFPDPYADPVALARWHRGRSRIGGAA